MTLAIIPVNGGQWTNVPGFALSPDKSQSVINYLLDEAGNGTARPGTQLFVTAYGSVLSTDPDSDTSVIGLFAFQDWLIAVTGLRRVIKIEEDGTQTDITGTIPLPGRGVPGFLNDNGTLLLFGGGPPLKWEPSMATCELFNADIGMPACTSIVVLNRYLLTNTLYSDRIYFSDPEDHASWDLDAKFFTAESRNDPVLAMETTFGELYAYGSETIDIYYFSASDDPLAPFGLAWTIQRGLGAARAQIKVDNTLYFLDTERKIIMLEGRDPKVISLEIERQLKALSRIDDCILHRLEFEGKHLLAFVFPTDKTTLVYDYVLRQWTEWREWSKDDGWKPMSMFAYAYQPVWNKHFCSGFSQTPEIYELTSSAQDDHGGIRRVERVTAPITHGTGFRKSSNRLRFRMQRGTATSADSTSEAYAPELWVEWQDDNGPWKGPRTVQLGRIGDQYMYRGELARMGMYRQRAYRFSMNDPVAFTLVSVEEDFDVMTD